MGEGSRIDTVGVKRVTCESCCESEDRPIPAKHHGLWQLFPLPGGVSCELGEDGEIQVENQASFLHEIYYLTH